jgi:parallel beta-helix repeat protein
MAINVLAGDAHSMDLSLNLLFNSATGRFEPALEDIHIYPSQTHPDADMYNSFTDPVSRRILSSPKLYTEFRKILNETSSDSNLKEDLAYYDELMATYLSEFYSDQTKNRGDMYVKIYMQNVRKYIEENYARARRIAAIETSPLASEENYDNPNLPGSFEYLYDTALIPREFIARHPEFELSENDIILPTGTYTFRESIVIPKNTRFVIRAGAKIYLAKGVSLVSYSPISALGTKDKPIFIGRQKDNENWGAIAVINTDERSDFGHIAMVGGSSSEPINGVIFTGMLSSHNAPLYVDNAQFYKDNDDDAVNVKYSVGHIVNSRFFETVGDALDVDVTDNFTVENNHFSNIGGDAIDISFANARILDNTITKCGDKGVSVGEKSNPLIEHNNISGCAIGIAVKDESTAEIFSNTLSNNDVAISLYKKKQIFGGAVARLKGNSFLGNGTNIQSDDNSKIIEL